MDPFELLKSSVSAVPAMKYALALVGVLSVIAIASALKIDSRVAVIGTVIILVLMVVLVIFAKLASYKSSFFAAPALVFTWFALLLLMAVSVTLFTSVFFQKPINLQYWVDQRQTISVTEPDPEIPQTPHYRRIYFENFNSTSVEDLQTSNLWLIGPKDDWQGTLLKGRYQLCNRIDNASSSYTSRFSYFDANNNTQDLSDSKVKMSVEIQGDTGKYSGAGILYRMKGKQYYAFLLQAGHSVSFYRADNGKVAILWSDDISQLMSDSEIAALEVIGNGSTLTLLVNSKIVYTHENAEFLEGEPGVFAYSTGCFLYDSMAVYQRLTN